MTKDDLKLLSEETFRDNDNGEIEPRGHRAFNNKMIDAMAMAGDFTRDGNGNKFLADDGSYKVIEEMDLTAIETDILPKEADVFVLGNKEQPFNGIFAGQINGVPVSRTHGFTHFLSGDGFYKELNSGWKEIREKTELGQSRHEIDWCVIGDSLILTGLLDSGSIGIMSFKVVLDEKYVKRMNFSSFNAFGDSIAKLGGNCKRIEIQVTPVEDGILIKPDFGELIAAGMITMYLAPLVIPLEPENVKDNF